MSHGFYGKVLEVNLSAAEMKETTPVSYTHLDVYKRQSWSS